MPEGAPALPADALEHAAELLASADAMVVGAGAGMGVDSGLPDFRGSGGLWRAYPALGARGLSFAAVASPETFEREPVLAWGFYGHRLALYRRTVPHAGFALLQRWGERMRLGWRVFTSNVDGQFQAAGVPEDELTECHGSIHHLQCSRPCSEAIWPAEAFVPDVDEAACALRNAPPRCPHCGALARPNILLFGDDGWIETRARAQQARLQRWLERSERIVVLEIGAGSAIPSVRHFSHELITQHGARLIRINPRESAVPNRDHVALPAPALASLQALEQALQDGSGAG